MSNTYFEQVPVEVVKKICKERIRREKERFTDGDGIPQNEEPNREQPISPQH